MALIQIFHPKDVLDRGLALWKLPGGKPPKPDGCGIPKVQKLLQAKENLLQPTTFFCEVCILIGKCLGPGSLIDVSSTTHQTNQAIVSMHCGG